jgi:hypothetical protein
LEGIFLVAYLFLRFFSPRLTNLFARFYLEIRKTPTSSGPNSYGKTYLGFCDSRKLAEKKLLEKAEELSKQ